MFTNKSTVLTLPKDRINTDYGVLLFGKASFNNFDESKYYENGIINQKGKGFIYNALKDKHRSVFFGARIVFETEERIDLNKLTKNEIQGLEWNGNQYSLGVFLALKWLYKKPTYIASGILLQIENLVEEDYPACYEAMLKLPVNTVSEDDERLLESTLIQRVQFKVSMPIAVARQVVRHRGFDYTELSRRYTDKTIEFFKPSKWRKQAKKATDCSIENEFVEEFGILITDYKNYYSKIKTVIAKIALWLRILKFRFVYEQLIKMSTVWFKGNIENGMSKEQARMILPQSMMTTLLMSGSLRTTISFLSQRLDKHTQLETREVAMQVYDIACQEFGKELVDKLIDIENRLIF
jgi:flavin-dependent thymidylate synthase